MGRDIFTLHNACAVHCWMFSILRGISLSTLGSVQYTRGYHEYCEWGGGGIMSTLGDVQYTGVSIQIETPVL